VLEGAALELGGGGLGSAAISSRASRLWVARSARSHGTSENRPL
jgi:hypothetical protein